MAAALAPIQIGTGFGPVGVLAGGLIAAGILLLAANKQGGSGDWRRHTNTAPSRKEARDRAQKAGHGHPPLGHGDHFHATDSKGRKMRGSHYKWGSGR